MSQTTERLIAIAPHSMSPKLTLEDAANWGTWYLSPDWHGSRMLVQLAIPFTLAFRCQILCHQTQVFGKLLRSTEWRLWQLFLESTTNSNKWFPFTHKPSTSSGGEALMKESLPNLGSPVVPWDYSPSLPRQRAPVFLPWSRQGR